MIKLLSSFALFTTLCSFLIFVPKVAEGVEMFALRQGAVGRVISVVGVASVAGVTLAVGDSIFPGGIIKTDSTSSVKIIMSDLSILDVGPSSEFEVITYQVNSKSDSEKVELGLKEGTVRAFVSKRLKRKRNFRITTKASIMGVQGTEFVIESSPSNECGETAKCYGSDRITVLEGAVNAATRDSKSGMVTPELLAPGTQALISSASKRETFFGKSTFAERSFDSIEGDPEIGSAKADDQMDDRLVITKSHLTIEQLEAIRNRLNEWINRYSETFLVTGKAQFLPDSFITKLASIHKNPPGISLTGPSSISVAVGKGPEQDSRLSVRAPIFIEAPGVSRIFDKIGLEPPPNDALIHVDVAFPPPG